VALQIGDAVGPYKITGVIGQGAMGQVYRVEHTITGRVEAMKVLLRSGLDTPEVAQQFLREIRVHASLYHPNIVGVYNALWAGEDLVLVMELVTGTSLESRLAQGRLPFEQALQLTLQALAALVYAHNQGLTHRDISPQNMVVTADGSLKLMDFGLAVRSPQAQGGPVGSLAYMAPEQVRGSDRIDHRSDIYSMGAVLYELASGRKPFPYDNPFTLMKAQVDEEPTPPTQIDARLPLGFDAVVRRAMAKHPDHRFPSAERFLEAVRALRGPVYAFAGDPVRSIQPVVTLPPLAEERRRVKWLPIAAAVGSLGVLAVVLTFARESFDELNKPVPVLTPTRSLFAPPPRGIEIPVVAPEVLPVIFEDTLEPATPRVRSAKRKAPPKPAPAKLLVKTDRRPKQDTHLIAPPPVIPHSNEPVLATNTDIVPVEPPKPADPKMVESAERKRGWLSRTVGKFRSWKKRNGDVQER